METAGFYNTSASTTTRARSRRSRRGTTLAAGGPPLLATRSSSTVSARMQASSRRTGRLRRPATSSALRRSACRRDANGWPHCDEMQRDRPADWRLRRRRWRVVAGHAWARIDADQEPGTLGSGRWRNLDSPAPTCDLDYARSSAPQIVYRRDAGRSIHRPGHRPTQPPARVPTVSGRRTAVATSVAVLSIATNGGTGGARGPDLPTVTARRGRRGHDGVDARGCWLDNGDCAMDAMRVRADACLPYARGSLRLLLRVALTRPDDAPLRCSSRRPPTDPYLSIRSGRPSPARHLYSVNAWLDVDAGFQARLNRSAPRAAFLAGATLRW